MQSSVFSFKDLLKNSKEKTTGKTKKGRHVNRAPDGVKLYDGSSDESTSDESSDYKESELNDEFLQFLKEDNTILRLIEGDKLLRNQSERFQAFVGPVSFVDLDECAKHDRKILGIDYSQAMRYATYIVKHKLTVANEVDPDDICCLAGSSRIPLPFERNSYFDTVELLLVPEAFTYFTMKKLNKSYWEATQTLYGTSHPTTFHLPLLKAEKVYSTKPKKDKVVKVNDVIIQSSEQDIFRQHTDAIVVLTHSNTTPINLPGFVSWADALGVFPIVELVPHHAVSHYEIKSEKCRSKFLFCAVASYRTNEEDLSNLAKGIFNRAEEMRCRTICIRIEKFKLVTKSRTLEVFLEQLRHTRCQYLKLVRFQANQKTLGAVYRE
uniref:Uncharacterized protein n=2 Tax=Clytia hemisphaerica TaxID=252671 RepID=A0A7M5VE13_9CNID